MCVKASVSFNRFVYAGSEFKWYKVFNQIQIGCSVPYLILKPYEINVVIFQEFMFLEN